MTTMMDWEETSPSPGGSASGSSANGHSEAEDETISPHRTSNLVTTLNLKLNNNNSTTYNTGSDKKLNHYGIPTKENSLLLNDGFNGLNLNPSPPAPVGHGFCIAISSSATSSLPLHLTRGSTPTKGTQSNTSSAVSGSGPSSQSSPNSTSTATKKHKPIPPPLDLSIGASSLNSSTSSSSSSTGSGIFQYPGTFYSPYYLGSPKFNQSEKSLPLRKRWHSWSPKLMNCSEDLIPLYTDPQSTTSGSPSGGKATANGSEATLTAPYGSNKCNSTLQPPSYSMPGSRGQGPSGNGNATPQSAGLQTPTPFYTPNEPSPRFMNSPVFSYSTPDTTLYQGPYSPIRTSTLYPPGSPFLNSNLNTPTFVMTNLSPPSSSIPSGSSTVGVGASSSGSSSSSTSSSSATAIQSTIPSMTLSTAFSSPSSAALYSLALLSPSLSQAPTIQHGFEDHPIDSKFPSTGFHHQTQPVWNIFLSGTKVRFINDSGQATGWYLVDHLAQMTDLSTILGIGFKSEYAPHGLSVKQYVVTSSARERVQITFSPTNNEHLRHPNIEADSESGHPFLVTKKGICAVKPEGFTAMYGSHCLKLEVLDVCVKLNTGGGAKQPHNHQSQSTNVFMGPGNPHAGTLRNSHSVNPQPPTSNTIGRPMISQHLIPPQMEDVKPSYADLKHSLSGGYMDEIKPFTHPVPLPIIQMSHHSPPQHHHHELLIKQESYSDQMETESEPPIPHPLQSDSGSKKSGSKAKKSKKFKESNNNSGSSTNGEPKGRRPMNAFLVYAKEKRPLLIQMYPGKDNRSISTLLGDSWKNLDPEEKNFYIKTAKDSADEQKKLHPDCWKRKRTQQQHQSNPPLPLKMDGLTKVS